MEPLYFRIPQISPFTCRRCLLRTSPVYSPKRLESSLSAQNNIPNSQPEQSTASIQSQSHSQTLQYKQPQTPKSNNGTKPSHLQITDHCFYWDTPAPQHVERSRANSTFERNKHSPVRRWVASRFRTIPMSDVPEVAFLGRSNVGKSSLLNMLMNDEICYTSKKPGRTREMNAYGVGGRKGGDAKVVIVDMPGYGKASHAEWGQEIMKYLMNRKQLRRVFVLIDSHHGIKSHDASILQILRENAIPHQVILSKVDSILFQKDRSQKQKLAIDWAELDTLKEIVNKEIKFQVQPPGPVPGALGEVLTCSAKMNQYQKGGLGIGAIRVAILRAVGFG